MQLPDKYQWANELNTPKIWEVAKKYYGVIERNKNGTINYILINWWKILGVFGLYKNNDFAWCGGFAAIVIKEAGRTPPKGFLGAKNWLNFGNKIWLPTYGSVFNAKANFMDVLVFNRPGGHHVGFAFAQNKNCFLVYGGNQSDKVGLAWILKSRCIGVVRPDYSLYKGEALKLLTESGEISTNEK